jgi:hypothetical protein
LRLTSAKDQTRGKKAPPVFDGRWLQESASSKNEEINQNNNDKRHTEKPHNTSG